MTDKEKMQEVLNMCSEYDTIDDILASYLVKFDITARETLSIINELNSCLSDQITSLEFTKYIAKERAGYLKSYLNEDMWNTEEAAKKNIQPQINNADRIIKACNQKWYKVWEG